MVLAQRAKEIVSRLLAAAHPDAERGEWDVGLKFLLIPLEGILRKNERKPSDW